MSVSSEELPMHSTRLPGRSSEGTRSAGHSTTVLYFVTASAIIVSVVSMLLAFLPWRSLGLRGGGDDALTIEEDDGRDARAPPVLHAFPGADPDSNVCQTVACAKEGAELFRQLDFHQEPCDDFYEYVCRRWELNHKLPYGAAKVSVDDMLLDEYEDLLAQVLQKGRPGYEAVRDVFLRCEYPRKGDTHWLETLTNIGLFPFPVVIKEGTKVDVIVKELLRLGIQPYYSVSVERDTESPEQAFLLVGEPNLMMGPLRLGLDVEYTYLDDALSGFVLEIVDQNHTIQSNVLRMERFLSSSMDRHAMEGIGLQDELLDVSEQFKDLSRRVREAVQDVFGTDLSKRPVKTSSLKYLHAIDNGDVESDLARFLNYLAFRTFAELSVDNEGDQGEVMRLIYSRYPGYASKTSVNRRRYCIRMMNRFEPSVLAHVSMDTAATKLGGKASYNSVLDLLESIFNETLYEQSGFDADFRESITSSMFAVNWEALVPEAVTSHNELFRQLIVIYETSAVSKQVIESYMKLATDMRFRDYAQKDLEKWIGWKKGVLNTYASLDSPFLKLEIPLPVFDFVRDPDASLERYQLARVGPRIFQPLYHAVYHLAYNYGIGRKPALLVSKMHALMDCLGRQYSKLRWKESKRRIGRNSYYSNLLDYLAMEPAYRAYIRYADRAKKNERLPKLENLTPRQLFFIHYARSFCEINNATYLDRVLDEASVAPAWYRVNGVLRNFRPFSEAFLCRPNSFMNPVHRCTLR